MSAPSNVIPISAAVAQARESARHGDGKFGTQARAESGEIDLMGGGTAAPVGDRAAEVVGAVDGMLSGELSSTPSTHLAPLLPALGEETLRDRSFSDEYVHPMMSACFDGDRDRAAELAQRLVELDEDEQRYLDQDWRPAGVQVTALDSMYGDTYTGDRYERSRPLTEVAKSMRADIKDAQAAGYIPEDLTYRVVKDGNSLRMIVEGMADEDRLFRDYHSPYAPGKEFHARPSWEANRLSDRLKGIGLAYAQTKSSGMSDYNNDSHFVTVELRSESDELFWRHEAEEKKLLAQARKLPAGDPRRAELNAQAKEMIARHQAERVAKRDEDQKKWDW